MRVSESLLEELNQKVKSFKGGCIKSYLHNWKRLTSDEEILNMVEGLSINLTDDLPATTPIQYPLGKEEHIFVMQEINRLLDRNIIQPCLVGMKRGNLYHPYF